MSLAWKFIQSERFAKILIAEVDKKLSLELSAEIDFEKIQLQVFPPATILKNVKFRKEEGDNFRLSIDAESLILDFGVGSFFTSKFLIEKISIEQGRLVLDQPEFNLSKLIEEMRKEENGKNLVVGDIYNFYQNQIYKKIGNRIKNLGLSGIYFKLNQDQVFLRKFDLELEKSFARMQLDLQNPILQNTTGLEDVIPDDFSFNGDIYKSVLLIDHLSLKTKFEKLFLKGRAYGENELNIVITGEYDGLLDNANKRINHEITNGLSGELNLKLAVNGTLENPEINIEAKASEINSKFFSIDKLISFLSIENGILKIKHLNLKKDKGEIILNKEFPLIDIKNNKLEFKQVDLSLKNYYTNDALKAIASSIDPLKGYLTGEVEIFYDAGSFLFSIKPGFRLDAFQLRFNEENPILENKGFVFGSSELLLDKNLDLGLNVQLKFSDGYIEAKGKLHENGIDIQTSRAKLDLNQFGAISGVHIGGVNDFKLKVFGPWSNVKLNFQGEIENFTILDFYLPKFLYDTTYEINNFKLELSKGIGRLQEGSLQSEGSINFLAKEPLNLNFVVDNLGFLEAKKIIKPIIDLLPWAPTDAYLGLDAVVSLKGGFAPSELDVKADVHSGKMKINLETFDKLDFSLSYKKSELNISDLILKKKKGLILGNLELNSASDFALGLKLNEMRLEDFEYYNLLNLGLESSLNGTFNYRRKQGLDQATLGIYASEGKIASVYVPDSNLRLELDRSNLKVDGNLFSGDIILDSLINISKAEKQHNSVVKLTVKSRSLKSLFGIFASHNILDQSLEGVLDAELRMDFNPYSIDSTSASIFLNKFVLSRDEFNIKAKSIGKVVSVSQGFVEYFNVELIGDENSLTLNGSGKFNKNLVLSGKSKISAAVTEFLTNKVADAKGFFNSRFNLSWAKNKFSNFVEFFGDDIAFLSKDLSVNLSNLSFKSTLNNEDFYLRSLKGEIGGGKFEISGEGKLQLPFPKINFRLSATETNLPILEKSKIIASSKIDLKGDRPPYQVGGAVNILYGLVEDDIEKILIEKYKDKKFERYIPKGVFTEGGQLFNLNVAVNSINEVRVVNSLMDIGLRGRVQIVGGLQNAQTMGELQFVPVTSKIKFRGHDFIIDSGFIEIEETNKQTESNLKLSALSNIDQYSIKMDISSIGDEVQINLSSSPPLAQEDILSLMTLGYTSDINKKLTEGDRQSVASVGVGSLLVERFKLGETLNSSFGLQLSVAPEFGEAEGSMLQSSQGAQTPTNQLKSATKISVRKKVNKRLGFSLSSTVGGSLDQKQEMNVDFDINKYLTIQGIYEVKEVDDDSNADPDSMGFDLRWRHTTK
jgi:translocation and assembly module TamB